MRHTTTTPSRSGCGSDASGRDEEIEHWVAGQLALAPPLSCEQLCRLQVLLAAHRVLASKSA